MVWLFKLWNLSISMDLDCYNSVTITSRNWMSDCQSSWRKTQKKNSIFWSCSCKQIRVLTTETLSTVSSPNLEANFNTEGIKTSSVGLNQATMAQTLKIRISIEIL